MLSSVFGRKAGRDDQGPAIGDADAHVFSCPACTRPLNDGTSRCPGCGSRLIMGVLVRRAIGLVALGLVFGAFLGGAGMASFIAVTLHPEPAIAAIEAPAIVAPSEAPIAVVPPATNPVTPGVPPAAAAALSGTIVINSRIAADAVTLRTTLESQDGSANDLAKALRTLAADAAAGMDLTSRMAPWTAATSVRAGLDDFYSSMATTARDGLHASLADLSAYRSTAKAMLAVTAGLDTVDASSRTLAATVGLDLPSLEP